MRASRLLTIQMLLQARGRMSARSLAEALEVSVRTLHRDIDQLGAAGVPVYADRGRHGGFALLEGWKTSLTGLTPAESQAVFLGGLAGPAAQLGLGHELQSAQLKLLAALPPAWRTQAQTVHGRLHLDPVDWYRDQPATPHLVTVAEAVWQERQLALRYASWTRTADRTVGPLGLVLKAGVWYLVALRDGQPRTFRIDQIGAAQVLDTPVQRPRGFDLAAWWQAATARFERELLAAEATVLATPDGLRALGRLGPAVAQRVARVGPPRRADGRVRLRFPIESVAQASGQLMRLAPEVEAVAPPALRDAVCGRLQRAAACYGLPFSGEGANGIADGSADGSTSEEAS